MKKKTKKKPKIIMVGNLKTIAVGGISHNPDYQSQHDGASANPRTIAVTYNAAESPVAAWYHRYKTIDETQLLAANEFRRLFEIASGHGAISFDYARERVDGGRVQDPFSDRRMDAGRSLKRISGLLGPVCYDHVRSVCGECRYPHDMARSRRGRDNITESVKAGLDILAIEFGYSSGTIRAYRCA